MKEPFFLSVTWMLSSEVSSGKPERPSTFKESGLHNTFLAGISAAEGSQHLALLFGSLLDTQICISSLMIKQP